MRKTAFALLAVLCLAAMATTSSIGAEEPPPTRAEILQLMEQHPLSMESWPSWRDYYIRSYYATEIDEPDEFRHGLWDFIGTHADQHQGQLIAPFADDPVAWMLLSRYYSKSRTHNVQAEEAARKAVSLGELSGLPQLNLASVLLSIVGPQQSVGLTREDREKLVESEQLLESIERTVPQAKLSLYWGLLALSKGDKAAAMPLLKQAVTDYPHTASVAITFLAAWLTNKDSPRPLATETEPCVKKFPNDALILAFHAVALYGDEQYNDAYGALQKARRLDASKVEMIGKEMIESIDEGTSITPLIQEGLKKQEQKLFGSAAISFRSALQNQPDNVLAARFLAWSLVADAKTRESTYRAASEINALSRRFPKDADLHVIRGASLASIGEPLHANDAFVEAEKLGGNVGKFVTAANRQKIRKDAEYEARTRAISDWILVGVGGLLAWIAVMFITGAILAAAIPRQPDIVTISEEGLSFRERWLERAYLVLLTLGLIIFYLTLPIVCLGLLAITLGLFFLLLALRVLHVGVLYRGLYAVTGVIRSATIGPTHDVLGLEVRREQYPRLFDVFAEVADRLGTKHVDSVYLTPTAAISVYDRGYGPFGLFGRSRVMEIGMPTFMSLTVSEFKSVLAHEFAHFSHQHTFYSRFIFQVSAPLSHSLAVMNAAGGAMNYINPFYGFYWLYLKAFELLAAGFSRSHEFLADRRAAYAYGKDVFRSSFTKIVVEGRLFQETVVDTIRHGLIVQRAHANVFDVFRQNQDQPEGQELRHRQLESLIAEKPGWYGSHPTYSERLAATDAVPDNPHPVDLTPSTNLLENIESIETKLTDMLTRYILDLAEMMDAANQY